MTKKIVYKIVLILLILIFLYIGSTLTKALYSSFTTPIEPVGSITDVFGEQTIDVIINGNAIKAEIARTESEQARGLMYRQNLDTNSGMLFIYEDEAQRTFWMKNTYVPLDIIFIDKDKKVVSISSNTKPNQTDELYYSKGKSQYVLELNSGKAEELKLKPGNEITF
jgi:uncharacterized membrane protein (UPF0127 family)